MPLPFVAKVGRSSGRGTPAAEADWKRAEGIVAKEYGAVPDSHRYALVTKVFKNISTGHQKEDVMSGDVGGFRDDPIAMVVAGGPATGPAKVRKVPGRGKKPKVAESLLDLCERACSGHICPKCAGREVRVREAHADTGMDEMMGRCLVPACGYSAELDKFEHFEWDDGKPSFEQIAASALTPAAKLRLLLGIPEGVNESAEMVTADQAARRPGTVRVAREVAARAKEDGVTFEACLDGLLARITPEQRAAYGDFETTAGVAREAFLIAHRAMAEEMPLGNVVTVNPNQPTMYTDGGGRDAPGAGDPPDVSNWNAGPVGRAARAVRRLKGRAAR